MYPTLFIRPRNCRRMPPHAHHHHQHATHHQHGGAPRVGFQQRDLPTAGGQFMGLAMCLGMFGFFFLISGGIIMVFSNILVVPGIVMFSVGFVFTIFCVVVCIRGRKHQQNMEIGTQRYSGVTTLGYSESGTQSTIVHPPTVGSTIAYGPGAEGYQGPPGPQGHPQACQLQSQQYPQGPPVQYEQAGADTYPPQSPYPPEPESQVIEPSAPPPAYEDALKQ